MNVINGFASFFNELLLCVVTLRVCADENESSLCFSNLVRTFLRRDEWIAKGWKYGCLILPFKTKLNPFSFVIIAGIARVG